MISLYKVFLKWDNPGLFFFIFVFSIQLTVNIQYKFLPMTEFEPWTSAVRSDRSTNCPILMKLTTRPAYIKILFYYLALKMMT